MFEASENADGWYIDDVAVSSSDFDTSEPPLITSVLGNPAPNSFQSGIGVISGWKCEAKGALTVRFFKADGSLVRIDGKDTHPLVYGTKRPDVPKAGFCGGAANVGFVTIWNWGELGDGEYTAVVYDNGVEFDRSTFTVTTLGTNFLRGVRGTFTLSDFPQAGDTTRIRWEEGLQNFVIIP